MKMLDKIILPIKCMLKKGLRIEKKAQVPIHGLWWQGLYNTYVICFTLI